MLASSIAISNFPLLHFEDTASFALQCMEDYDIQHLPLSLLPVLNEQQECTGVILQKNLNDLLAQFLGVDHPGAIIVVSVSPYQYSLAELSRLVETNNAQISQLNTHFDEATGALIITIKLNKEEADIIIATLQRYNYQVVHYFGNTIMHNDIEDHYHHLMNYLDV